ncbi:MAG: HEPN domain-containing protein [Nanoarchaeota archaeon]|nr:HEPN domain-containing protein [Nanoarchaeota archaeon]MBU0963276.1 HEPN domain-containing protein [Nanoarchaeota archaeon]
MKIIRVNKELYKNYLKKAQENFESMNDNIDNNRWNGAVVNAVHCVINSADALTIFFKGERHAGEKHEDVVKLLKTINIMDNKKIQQLLNVLHLKNKVEYEEVLVSETNAKDTQKSVERFLNWIKEILKE